MSELLNNPFVQSALLPFVVALILALGLARLGSRWTALAVPVAVYLAVYVIRGWNFFPLRSTNKILLAGVVAIAVALVLEFVHWRRWRGQTLAIAGAVLAAWLVWPRLGRVQGWELVITLGVPALSAAWWCAWANVFQGHHRQAYSALMLLATATSLCAMLGATALYGQVAGAVAAACGAMFLLWLLGRPIAAGWLLTLPAVVLLVLLGIGAVVYAKLAWYNLVLFALIPVLVMVPLPNAWPRWLQGGVGLALGAVPAAIAVYLTWGAAEGLPY